MKHESKRDSAMRELLGKLRQGEFLPGARFPSGRQLAAELKISYVTANNVLRELERSGFLRRIAGVGTFVASPAPVPQTEGMRIGYFVDVNESVFARFFSTVLANMPGTGRYDNIPLRMLPGQESITAEQHAQWMEEVFQSRWDSLVVYGDRHFPFREMAKYQDRIPQLNFIFHDDTELDFAYANRIVTDSEKSGLLAGRHFLGKGRKKLAVISLRILDEIYRRRIGDTVHHHGIQVLNGLQQAYEEAGEDFFSLVRTIPFPQTLNAEHFCELIRQGFDSFFVMGDSYAAVIYEAAAKLHLAVGKDIEILGMYNILQSTMFHPPLSSISVNEVRIGELLARAVCEKWHGKTIRVAPELICRESSPAGETAEIQYKES